jgi:hypothetical protein
VIDAEREAKADRGGRADPFPGAHANHPIFIDFTVATLMPWRNRAAAIPFPTIHGLDSRDEQSP